MQGIREIEFEFDEGGAGEFRPSGNVVSVITDYLKRDDLGQAVSLLAASTPEVGDRLIEEARVGASEELWRRLAKLFGSARDMGRAAMCAHAVGEHEMAAGYHEAAYEWEGAAEAYRKAGNLVKAAEMLERGMAFDKAGATYYEAGEHLKAAECYARAGAYYHAGHLYMKLGRYEQAVEVLQRVDRMQKWFVESSRLLGHFFEKTGNSEMAVARYADVVRSHPLDEATVEVHHRLANLLAASGRAEHAQRLWSGVLGFHPQHEGALDGMKLLTAGTGAPTAPPAAAPAASPGGVAPLVLPGDDGGDERAAGPARVVAVRGDFDVLRGLPVFSDLSLDELRAVHTLADRATFPAGQVLIEQGRPGEGLFVIVSGKVKVEVLSDGKPPVQVAELGPGSALGEMAMVDEAPTSARVTAVSDVSAFRFPIDRLVSHLGTDSRAGFKVMRVLGRILSTRLREANRALAG